MGIAEKVNSGFISVTNILDDSFVDTDGTDMEEIVFEVERQEGLFIVRYLMPTDNILTDDARWLYTVHRQGRDEVLDEGRSSFPNAREAKYLAGKSVYEHQIGEAGNEEEEKTVSESSKINTPQHVVVPDNDFAIIISLYSNDNLVGVTYLAEVRHVRDGLLEQLYDGSQKTLKERAEESILEYIKKHYPNQKKSIAVSVINCFESAVFPS